MVFTIATSFLAFVSVALAQAYPGPAPSASSSSGSSSSSAAASAPSAVANTTGHINVNVSPGGQFAYEPSNFNATNGTLVTFFFTNSATGPHSVTQSSFANPCTYLTANTTDNAPAGFDSGLVSNVQYTINITNDQEPIWFHCKQLTHCGVQGMVGSINAPASGSNTFAAFQSAAKALGSSAPAQNSGSAVTGGFNAVATATPANTASSSASSSSPTSSSVKNIASMGVVLLSVVAVLVLA